MASIIQCACFAHPRNFPTVSRRFQFNRRYPFAGSSYSLSLELKNFVFSIHCAPLGLFPTVASDERRSCRNSVLNTIQSSEDASEALALASPLCRTHNQGPLVVRFSSMAFLFSNTILLAYPLEAMAETCTTDNSIFNMPLLLLVALIGATVGGLLARQRKEELQKLNEQLRQINAALRRQAKIESYAPTLSYAPVAGKIPDSEVVIDPRKHELTSRLKAGKNYLRNQDFVKAFSEFKEALVLAQSMNDPTEEKKAARGLGASLQRQGKYQEAIKYHSMVLSTSKRTGEESGNTEAYGAIADCYTELGDLEKAGKFYDMYIARLQSD